MYSFVICLWGVWLSFKALRAEKAENMLKFWSVFATFVIFDAYVDWLFRWIPGHAIVKYGLMVCTFLSPKDMAVADLLFGHLALPLCHLAHRLSSRTLLFLFHFFLNFEQPRDDDKHKHSPQRRTQHRRTTPRYRHHHHHHKPSSRHAPSPPPEELLQHHKT